MFFCAAFQDLGAVVHSQWNDGNTWCKLRILITREAGDKLLGELPPKEADALREHLTVLKEGRAEAVEIVGLAALSLSTFVATYGNNVAGYQHIPNGHELLGFWEPPKQRRSSAPAIIMWFDPDEGYHVAIAHSKKQAEVVIESLNFLAEDRQRSIRRKIRSWTITAHSSKYPQRIGGIHAELLCRASVVQKAMDKRRGKLN